MSAGAPDYLRCSSARVVRLMNSDVRALEWCASRTPMFERRSGAPDELRCSSAGVVRLMNSDDRAPEWCV